MRRARSLVLVASVALLVAAGCGLRRDRFYTLSATAGATGAPRSLRVGLGPVVVPEYLDSPMIVTRLDANRVHYAPFDRWASPLSQQVSHVLAENLAAAGTVVPYPWYSSAAPDVVVRVNLLAFESDASGAAHLDAAWSVVEQRTGALRKNDRTTLTEPAAGRTTQAAVAALSRTLVDLAQRIAEELPAAASRP